MAQDFSAAFEEKKPIKTIASLGATNFELVTVPNTTKRISVGCELTALYVSFSYADAAAASTVDCTFIPAANFFTMVIPNNIDSFTVISKTGTASNVVIILEEAI